MESALYHIPSHWLRLHPNAAETGNYFLDQGLFVEETIVQVLIRIIDDVIRGIKKLMFPSEKNLTHL